MPLDHGLLNLPLAKRGDLDAQAQRSVRAEAQKSEMEFRAARQRGREKFAQAKALIEATPDERMAELGRPHKLTAKQARAQFLSAARSNPDRLIQSFSQERR